MGYDFICGCRKAINGAWFPCDKHQLMVVKQENEYRKRKRLGLLPEEPNAFF